MASPTVKFTIKSGGLGNSPPSPAGTIWIAGCSSDGDPNVVSGPYADPNKLTDDYGYGPGVELCAALVQAGLQPFFTKMPSTTPGDVSAVTPVGTSATVMTVTGDPNDAYNTLITLTRTGNVGSDPEPGFTVSLDGGESTSGEIRMPSSGDYEIPNTGLTLHFTAAGTVKGDSFTFTTTAPAWGNSDITDAVNALKISTKSAGLLYIVGPMDATAAGVYSTALSAFLTAKKFERACAETVDFDGDSESDWMDAIEAQFVTFADDRISIAATPILYPSALSGVQFRRTIGWPYILRLGQIPVSVSAAEVDLGALPGVTTVYHDEAQVPGLDDDRFVTATSIPGLTGYFITRPNLMHDTGSDFSEMQYGRIMDEACRITYNFFVKKLNSRVRLNKAGKPRAGKILEKDARALESGNDAKLNSGLVATGDVSDAQTVVSRDDDISSTKTLTVTVKILPPGYIETVDITMTFTNPALGGA